MQRKCLNLIAFGFFIICHFTFAQTPTFSIENDPFDYAGEYSDNESHLQYLNARYYNPTIMRFSARDSFDLLNRYAYADGNPVMNADPSGHISDSVHDLLMGTLVPTAGVGTTMFLVQTMMNVAMVSSVAVGKTAYVDLDGTLLFKGKDMKLIEEKFLQDAQVEADKSGKHFNQALTMKKFNEAYPEKVFNRQNGTTVQARVNMKLVNELNNRGGTIHVVSTGGWVENDIRTQFATLKLNFDKVHIGPLLLGKGPLINEWYWQKPVDDAVLYDDKRRQWLSSKFFMKRGSIRCVSMHPAAPWRL